MSKIEEALHKNFEQHKVIFWYDEKEELLNKFKALDLSGVTSIEVEGNEFEVKHQIYKSEPESKFLLYFKSARPDHKDNWLLDVELANHIFHTDQEAMFLQEIGLDYHYKELVAQHLEFFKHKERRNKLRLLLSEDDTWQELQMKMLAVVFGTENINLLTYIHAHCMAFANSDDRFEKDLERYNLSDFYWKRIEDHFKYDSENPTLYDFLIEVFRGNFALGQKSKLSRESKLLISLWQNTSPYNEVFSDISKKLSGDLEIEDFLNEATLEEIIDDKLFELVDKRIIQLLADLITTEQISHDRVFNYIKTRQNKFWFSQYENLYNALKSASELFDRVSVIELEGTKSFEDGIKSYVQSGYRIDQLYRKYIRYFRKANQNRILSSLTAKVEKIYTNDWLLKSGDHWQQTVDGITEWCPSYVKAQKGFFRNTVQPIINKGNRLFVIITDGLRYECGQEVVHKIRQENRFDTDLDYLVTNLPSYTQLGMASLLPHKELSFKEGSDLILADNKSTSGKVNRMETLNNHSGVPAAAFKAEEFMSMNAAGEGRELIKELKLIYIYHNRIDKTGDTLETEEKVFDAVEEEVYYLIDLIKKISNMNGNNVIITSDHGFLHQNEPVQESDFINTKIDGEVWKSSRRFVLGKNLKANDSFKHFKAVDLGINSEADVLIPKSINRFRSSGGGSRYTHGGASLQEIVVPLLHVSKKRKDTTQIVDVDIIKSTDRITTTILAVNFIQSDLVKDNVLPRSIRAGFYAEDGTLISDVFDYVFDIEVGSERQREVKNVFHIGSVISKKYKNQQAKLVIQEPIEGSNKWRTYKEFIYTLKISFGSDFEDF